MSVTKQFVKSECKRMFGAIPLLSSLDDGGKLQIVDTLVAHCQSNEHVTACLKYFAENALDWRNPVAELVAIARKTELDETVPPGCPRCDLGEHPTTGEQRWAPHVPGERNGYSMAVRCDCRRGQWLAARDERRKAVALAAKASSEKRPGKFDDRPDQEAV